MMGILPRFIGYGERKLGVDFPQKPVQFGDRDDMSPYEYPEPTFSKEQRQFLVDTAKVTVTDFVGSAVRMIGRGR